MQSGTLQSSSDRCEVREGGPDHRGPGMQAAIQEHEAVLQRRGLSGSGTGLTAGQQAAMPRESQDSSDSCREPGEL